MSYLQNFDLELLSEKVIKFHEKLFMIPLLFIGEKPLWRVKDPPPPPHGPKRVDQNFMAVGMFDILNFQKPFLLIVSQMDKCLKFKSVLGDKNDCTLYKMTP